MGGLGEYNIGDYIEAELKEGGRLRGTITKIVDDPDKGYAYLVLDNGWAVHPDEYQYCRDGDIIYRHEKKKKI